MIDEELSSTESDYHNNAGYHQDEFKNVEVETAANEASGRGYERTRTKKAFYPNQFFSYSLEIHWGDI